MLPVYTSYFWNNSISVCSGIAHPFMPSLSDVSFILFVTVHGSVETGFSGDHTLLMTTLSDANLAICSVENWQWRLKCYNLQTGWELSLTTLREKPGGMAEFKLIQTPTLALAFGLVIRFCVVFELSKNVRLTTDSLIFFVFSGCE